MTAGVTLYKGKKSKDYLFQDRTAKDFIERSGTQCNVHKYLGTYTQNADGTVSTATNGFDPNALSIEDITVLENRDRQYDTTIVDLRGCFIVQDPGFDLSQFGIMLSGDTVLIEFHLNDHVEKLGRKLMSGDVIEIPSFRDELPLDETSAPIPKYYVVQDAMWAAAGFGPTWYMHTWRVKCTPIIDSQEYQDILQNPAGQADTEVDWQNSLGSTSEVGTGAGVQNESDVASTAGSSATTLATNLQLTALTNAAAKAAVSKRAFFIQHLYVRPANTKVRDSLIAWVMDDNAIPPNWDGDFIPSGITFPQNPCNGDYFIRLDYEPISLFYRIDGAWRMVQQEWRTEWTPASRILDSYLRNNNITIINPTDTGTFPEKQPLSDVIPVQADVMPGTKNDDPIKET